RPFTSEQFLFVQIRGNASNDFSSVGPEQQFLAELLADISKIFFESSGVALVVAPDLIALYRGALQQAVDVAGGPGGWLEQEITREYQQIRQAAYDDPFKLGDKFASGTLRPVSNDDFDAEAAYLIQFARQRSAFVRAQLNSGLILQ